MIRLFHIFVLLHLLTGTVFSSTLKLEGRGPPGISEEQLLIYYTYFYSVLQPGITADTTPVVITFYTQSDERKLGVRLPEWGGGGAIGRDNIIIPVDKFYAFYNADFFKITLHELVHIVVARTYGHLRVPRWFNEGLAMVLSGEISFEGQVFLSRAVFTNNLLPLDSIENLNSFDSWKAQLAYHQSHAAVDFLLKNYGYDLLPELLSATRALRSFQAACISTFGLSPKEFELLLKKEISLRHRYIFIIADYYLFWIFIVFLALVGFILTIVRNRQKMKALELQDLLDDKKRDESSPTEPIC